MLGQILLRDAPPRASVCVTGEVPHSSKICRNEVQTPARTDAREFGTIRVSVLRVGVPGSNTEDLGIKTRQTDHRGPLPGS